MKPNNLTKFAAAAAMVFTATTATSHSQVTLDGIYTPGEAYNEFTFTTFFNGHDDANYGDFDTQFGKTFALWGTSTLAGDTSGTEYFFLYTQTPLAIKNMVWGDGMTAEEISQYGKVLSYGGATGSEELNLLDSSGDEILTIDFASNLDGKPKVGGVDLGLVAFRDSADYLIGNGLADFDSSDNSDVPMGFELMFELDAAKNQLVIDSLANGLDFHLSPDRGLIPPDNPPVPPCFVPEPSSALLLVGGLSGLLFRRRR